jgi:hypothetical protein
MVVDRALLLVGQDFVGADDLPESQRGIRIVGPDVGMCALDGPAKRRAQRLGVIVWKSPKQIVKRIHCALAAGFTRPPSEIPVAKFTAEYASTNSPQKNHVDPVGRKNGFAPPRQKSFSMKDMFA